jgi:hypothetical protein
MGSSSNGFRFTGVQMVRPFYFRTLFVFAIAITGCYGGSGNVRVNLSVQPALESDGAKPFLITLENWVDAIKLADPSYCFNIEYNQFPPNPIPTVEGDLFRQALVLHNLANGNTLPAHILTKPEQKIYAVIKGNECYWMLINPHREDERDPILKVK